MLCNYAMVPTLTLLPSLELRAFRYFGVWGHPAMEQNYCSVRDRWLVYMVCVTEHLLVILKHFPIKRTHDRLSIMHAADMEPKEVLLQIPFAVELPRPNMQSCLEITQTEKTLRLFAHFHGRSCTLHASLAQVASANCELVAILNLSQCNDGFNCCDTPASPFA